MDNNIYLDHNATSPLLPEAQTAMNDAAGKSIGNPSSPHWAGRDAKILLEEARNSLAKSLGAEPREIIFTSGGSESNNAVLRQLIVASGEQHLITSAIEHPSVLETCRILAKQPNISLTELPVDSSGLISPESLKYEILSQTTLISLMAANNETGCMQPIGELCKIAREHEISFHTDMVQTSGKIKLDLNKSGIDFASVTSHKIGGPRGIGLLYARQGTSFESLVTGGKQERVRRAGTENVTLAVGFAKALEWYLKNQERLQKQNTHFREKVLDRISNIDGFFQNTNLDQSLHHTLNFGFSGISAESLLISLDLDGVAVSTGSACSSGAMEESHVLLAMGRSRAEAKSSLRVSWGWSTKEDEIDYFLDKLTHHIHRLRHKQLN